MSIHGHEAYRRCLPVASAVPCRTKALGIAKAKEIAREHPGEVACYNGPRKQYGGAVFEHIEQFVCDGTSTKAVPR